MMVDEGGVCMYVHYIHPGAFLSSLCLRGGQGGDSKFTGWE